jgi:hypothetical protein
LEVEGEVEDEGQVSSAVGEGNSLRNGRSRLRLFPRELVPVIISLTDIWPPRGNDS